MYINPKTSKPCAQINDRYEFPDELDLDYGDGRLLSANADRGVRNLYALHSVLVHSGGVHGGHYYAFIRPDGKRWLKFDDEKARTPSLQALPGTSRYTRPPPLHCSACMPRDCLQCEAGPLGAPDPHGGACIVSRPNAKSDNDCLVC